MTIRAIRLVGEPILREPAERVTRFGRNLDVLTDDLLATLRHSYGLAVAAPQIGIRKQVFVFSDEEHRKRDVIVNPAIAESDGECEMREGCLSLPNLFFDIVRPATVCMVGHDRDGNDIEIEASGLQARIFQHEIDHLNGVLLTAHLSKEQLDTLRDWSNPHVRALRKGLKSVLPSM